MTAAQMSGILPIEPYDEPLVLAEQLRWQEAWDGRREMVAPMRRKLERINAKARRPKESAAVMNGK